VFVQGAEAGDFKRLDPVITSILTLSILNAIERWFRDDGRLDRGELTQRIVGFTKASLEKE
jgi:hypothetical protein